MLRCVIFSTPFQVCRCRLKGSQIHFRVFQRSLSGECRQRLAGGKGSPFQQIKLFAVGFDFNHAKRRARRGGIHIGGAMVFDFVNTVLAHDVSFLVDADCPAGQASFRFVIAPLQCHFQ
nr:MAG TPA: hypothetical protein [Bacteriophage sp.]